MKQQGKRLVVVRAHRSLHYSTLKLVVIEDPRLSYKAKGLHTYLMSRPPNWQIYYHDLLARAIDGKDSVTSGLRELKKCGYLHIATVRDDKKRIVGRVWHVYEDPRTEASESPYPGNPDAENPSPENPQQSINNYENNNQNTTTSGVVEGIEKSQTARTVKDILKDLALIVRGTPFTAVDYTEWLRRPDFLNSIDKIVQAYANDFTKVKEPETLVRSIMLRGARTPEGYVPYRQRLVQANAAAAETARKRVVADEARFLREAAIAKYHALDAKARANLLTEASAALGPVLGASPGLCLGWVLSLLQEQDEPAPQQDTSLL